MGLLRAISAYFLAVVAGLVALRLLPQDAAAALGFKSTRPVYAFNVVVDPASHTAITAVNTTVTVPAGAELLSTDLIVPIPPVTLEPQIHAIGAYYASSTTLKRTSGACGPRPNPSIPTRRRR